MPNQKDSLHWSIWCRTDRLGTYWVACDTDHDGVAITLHVLGVEKAENKIGADSGRVDLSSRSWVCKRAEREADPTLIRVEYFAI